MSNDPVISNSYASNNPDLPTAATDVGTPTHPKYIQHNRIDIGVGTARSLVDSTNPLPTTLSGTLGTISALPDYLNGGITLDTQYGSERLVATGAVVTATGGTLTFTSAAHQAQRGDRVAWQGVGFSANPNVERTVESVTTNTITMSAAVTNTIQSGDTYNIYRPLKVRVAQDGSTYISASTLPLPSGASTAALQSSVQAYDGNTAQYYNRCGGYDVTASDWFPIPTGGFGTFVPVGISTGIYGAGAASTGTLTAAAQTVILNSLDAYCEGTVSIKGTYSATVAFEVLKDSVWYALPCWRVEGGTAAESSSGALVNTSRAWRFNFAGFETFRVRCSAYVSGTVTVNINEVSFGTHTSQTLLPTGQTTMAGSQSVSIASDQTDIPMKFVTPTSTGGWPNEIYTASLSNTGTSSSGAKKLGWYIANNASVTNSAFIKVYDKSSAATSADTPKFVIGLAPGASANFSWGDIGKPLANGLSIRATTLRVDSDTTSPTANDVSITFGYA